MLLLYHILEQDSKTTFPSGAGFSGCPQHGLCHAHAAEAVEAEQAKVGAPGTSALAVQEEEPEHDPLQDFTERFEELLAAIGFRR